jgi:Flp pilus assembly pilin Flp
MQLPLRTWVRLQAGLRRPERGQTLTEYAILIGFLSVGLILVLIFLRDRIHDLFTNTGSSLERAPDLSTTTPNP